MNIRTRSLRPIVAIVAALALIPTLAACSFEIVNDSNEPTGDTPQGTESGGGEKPDGLDRGAFDAMVSQALSCEEGSVAVDASGGVFKVEGDCAQLNVDAAGAVVLAGSTGSVTIDGTGNTVFVDSVESIELAGTGNTVVWSEGSPVVEDSGVGNVATSSRD